ncbi:MAG TPA: cobalamin-dependent protein [Phycisphaerales bacterium]|nr:cobalamin-dependent protein [Phycisphaerales bacterium]
MTTALNVPTTEFEKKDRCADLPHRPRVLLGKMGLDGHDRGVKVIARALRDSGVHVIYSGLWQTPRSLAISARDEDCDVICASMMSNSHLVLGPRLVDELKKLGRPDLPVYMGGILPQEDLPKLMEAGIGKCFTTGVGLLDIVNAVHGATKERMPDVGSRMSGGSGGGNAVTAQLARDISLVHDGKPLRAGARRRRPRRVIGVTGSPGAGKSTLVASMAAEFVRRAQAGGAGEPGYSGRCAVIAFDPMSPITGGALLGDRLRVDFNTLDDKVYYRSLAISGEDYASLPAVIELIGGAFDGDADGGPIDTLFVETVGAGQNETKIRKFVDTTAVVLTPGMGDAVQMDKAGILEIADLFVCNKADHPGENELVRDLRDVAGRRPILETVATRGQGITDLLAALIR